MARMTKEAIKKHKKNPNVILKFNGQTFTCSCGCNLFHHINDDEEYHCNKCKCVYDVSEDIYKV